ncbi:hypothetical protein Thimo_0772 [Thioflavicoccus mobilis 8321]|uniref:PilZ domain-containing protein n=1 Tax=Thioflavicoccus mobilis 8321 TaxID=765912 RepID=L0GUE4_9GAMM|nr:hypothetical protein [Thioflavicoccus mobilis]AGA89611.1 hypothetical protein Thimo_0772 [Thioflavicoccus mobilis 8321]
MQLNAERAHVARRLPVDLRVPDLNTSAACCTYEIGTESLFVDGGPALKSGQAVELTFEDGVGRRVAVDCVVECYTGSRLFLRYCNLHEELRARLEQIIWPSWDGSNLLDGLVLTAGRFGAATLQDWLRLTNVLASIQPHLVNRKRFSV